ncbi:flagellar motor switch protein FliM [Niallia taxi]|uniref:flagellar motor switch protein FliM n=1 Tax=Niallia taxi TaxID=2499688 RepID=UPI0015F627F1|nr:flagellar motor switch protein FliM [Niallia taxi]
MPEVLSQNEIDALLSSLNSGEVKPEDMIKKEIKQNVRLYDFKRAMRFSKEQIRNISRVYENYARLLTTFFSAQLRTYVQVSVVSLEQITYEEFIQSIPDTTILNVFTANPLEGRMVMEVNPHVAYAILERTLGGPATSMGEIDSLTEIEASILERFFAKSLGFLKEPWKSVADLQPKLVTLETNPQFIQVASQNETVVVVTLNAKIGNISGMINFCLPHVALEPVIPKLSAHHWLNNGQVKTRQPDEINALENRVKLAQVPVIAELGKATINIQDFLTLAIGDVIRLDKTLEDPVTIKVGDKEKFHGQAGVSRGKQAVQIISSIKEEVDDYDK